MPREATQKGNANPIAVRGQRPVKRFGAGAQRIRDTGISRQQDLIGPILLREISGNALYLFFLAAAHTRGNSEHVAQFSQPAFLNIAATALHAMLDMPTCSRRLAPAYLHLVYLPFVAAISQKPGASAHYVKWGQKCYRSLPSSNSVNFYGSLKP